MDSEEEAEAEVVEEKEAVSAVEPDTELDIALGQEQESEAEAAAEQEPAPDAAEPQEFQQEPEVKAAGSPDSKTDEVAALAPVPGPAADTSKLVETTTKLCLYDVHVVFGSNGSSDAEMWYCIQHKPTRALEKRK
jgi:hypothetical protein